MSRILVVAQPEYGHVLPILPILERLRSNGHEIVVMSNRQTRLLLERHSFASELWIEEPACPRDSANQSGYSFWYEHTQHHRIPIREFVLERVAAAARRHMPDLYILDSLMTLSYGVDTAQRPFCGRAVLLGTLLPRWDTTMLRMTVPLLLLCPAELELPGFLIRHPMVHYVEPSCGDLFEPGTLNHVPTRPLVLTAFGTQSSLQRSFMKRLNAVSAVAANHQNIDFVVGVSESLLHVFELHGGKLPDNVSLQTRMAQRSLLKQASAFITHGGLSSIKEAVILGVPMIITPEVFDQPFNAMRAVHHGLASAIFPDEMSAQALEHHLDGILIHPTNNEKVTQFQKTFLKHEANPRAAYLIEEQIANHLAL